jgi:dTDP-4-amino-4,6-dideoxygalactose transaminase
VSTRRKYASILTTSFSRIPGLRVTVPPADIGHAYYKYYVFVRPEKLRPGWGRDRIMQAILAEGVPCFSGSCSEIYLENAFSPEWRPKDRLAVARELGETSLMFQVHPTLSEEAIEGTCRAVEKVLTLATSPASLAVAAKVRARA